MSRVLAFLFSIVVCTVAAQNQKPCSSEQHKQFDFWEGNWKVYDIKGKLIGTNKIVKMHNRCVMQENWESKTSSNKGTSYNYFDLTDKTWNQVWVDNSGYSLNLKGQYTDGSMVLKSKLVKAKKGNYYNRVTWTKKDDGSVTQVWDFINKEGKIIQEVFRGIYKKD